MFHSITKMEEDEGCCRVSKMSSRFYVQILGYHKVSKVNASDQHQTGKIKR
jgi:hypothetical protein